MSNPWTWTDAHKEDLKSSIEKGLSLKEIAYRTGRTYKAIEIMCCRMHLSRRAAQRARLDKKLKQLENRRDIYRARSLSEEIQEAKANPAPPFKPGKLEW